MAGVRPRAPRLSLCSYCSAVCSLQPWCVLFPLLPPLLRYYYILLSYCKRVYLLYRAVSQHSSVSYRNRTFVVTFFSLSSYFLAKENFTNSFFFAPVCAKTPESRWIVRHQISRSFEFENFAFAGFRVRELYDYVIVRRCLRINCCMCRSVLSTNHTRYPIVVAVWWYFYARYQTIEL